MSIYSVLAGVAFCLSVYIYSLIRAWCITNYYYKKLGQKANILDFYTTPRRAAYTRIEELAKLKYLSSCRDALSYVKNSPTGR